MICHDYSVTWGVKGSNADAGSVRSPRNARPNKSCTRAASSSPRSQLFTYGPTLSRQITCLFFSCCKLAYKGVCVLNFVVELAYIPSTNHRKKPIVNSANELVTQILEGPRRPF